MVVLKAMGTEPSVRIRLGEMTLMISRVIGNQRPDDQEGQWHVEATGRRIPKVNNDQVHNIIHNMRVLVEGEIDNLGDSVLVAENMGTIVASVPGLDQGTDHNRGV
jgi:hypothetical protein